MAYVLLVLLSGFASQTSNPPNGFSANFKDKVACVAAGNALSGSAPGRVTFVCAKTESN